MSTRRRATGQAKKSKRSVPATPTDARKTRIARVAKGKTPRYFSDPAIDKLLWMTITLMEELSVTRDRLDAVERLLDRKRVLSRSNIDAFKPDTKTSAERAARRAAYVDRVMRALHVELEELGDEMPRSVDEVVAAVDS